jgi:integrase/recombinase XerD
MDDSTLIRMWLHPYPETTRDVYRRAATRLQRAAPKPLAEYALDDLQRHVDGLAHLAARTRAKEIAALNSLFNFLVERELIVKNPAALLKAPKIRNDLTERILSADEVQRLIAAAEGRDRTLLRAFYFSGGRLSEICGMRWRDLTTRGEGGQVMLHGKGGKSRPVKLPEAIFAELNALRSDAKPGDLVFRTTKRTAQRIIKRAAAKAGINERASLHWLRHSCASHSLDNGCPPHVLQQTLGHASLTTTTIYAHARPDQSASDYLKG